MHYAIASTRQSLVTFRGSLLLLFCVSTAWFIPSTSQAECDARSQNPNHIRVEKLARDYVYYVDDPQTVDQRAKQLAARKAQLADLENFPWPDPRVTQLKMQLQKEIAALEKYAAEQQRLREMLAADGFEIIDGVSNGDTDLQAHVYRDLGNPGETYIVFRGTEGFSSWGDFHTDLPGADKEFKDWLDMGGIGESQYDSEQQTFERWANRDYQGAVVAGQSLGAALGQIYIAKHPQSVKEGVLFNVPGVTHEIAEEFKNNGGSLGNPPITIYVAANDPVSVYGGETHLPADVVELSGGNVDKSANIDITELDAAAKEALSPLDFPPQRSRDFFDQKRPEGARQHRGTMLQGNSGTDCRRMTSEEYQATRQGQDSLSHDKLVDVLVDVLEFLTPSSRKEMIEWMKWERERRQSDIDADDWLDWLFPDLTGFDNAEDQKVIDDINKALAEYEARNIGGGSTLTPLPQVSIRRPPPW